jgi:cell division protein FtsZ
MENRLSVTIISSLAAENEVATQTMPAPSAAFLAPPPPILEQPEEIPPNIDNVVEPVATSISQSADLISFERPSPAETPPAPPSPVTEKSEPRLIAPKKKPLPEKQPTPELPLEKPAQPKQEVLQFEPVTRGRFEKSEPTIIAGQDLDIPTFLRKNIRVK